MKNLTNLEKDILFCAALGYSVKETADDLRISHYTVKDYRQFVTAKLGAKNMSNAVAIAIYRGFLRAEEIASEAV